MNFVKVLIPPCGVLAFGGIDVGTNFYLVGACESEYQQIYPDSNGPHHTVLDSKKPAILERMRVFSTSLNVAGL
jgi:hypothetical protein